MEGQTLELLAQVGHWQRQWFGGTGRWLVSAERVSMVWQGGSDGGTDTGAAGTGELIERAVVCGDGVSACVHGMTRC